LSAKLATTAGSWRWTHARNCSESRRPSSRPAETWRILPHLHALVTGDVFSPTGWFVAFPKIDLYVLEHCFRRRVLRMLLRKRRRDEAGVRTLFGWRHPGFSLYNAVRLEAQDSEGRRAISECVLRSPIAL
jgi:hypothetical protein